MKRKGLLLLVLSALIAGAAYAYSSQPSTAKGTITASGTIEADTVRVSAQVGGRIQSLAADEGDDVKAGQPLVGLDDALVRTALAQARAGQSAAEAQLAQAQAGARPEDLRRAEAAVAVAQAALDGARVAWEDAKAARANPQELDLTLAAARTQLAVAGLRAAQAAAGKDAYQAQYDLWAQVANMVSGVTNVCFPTPAGQVCQDFKAPSDAVQSTSFQWNLSSQQLAGGWDSLALANAARDGAQANLDSLLAQRRNPQTANALVDGAFAQLQVSQAALNQAQATLALARAGASPEQIQMAQAGLRQAQAAVQAVQLQLDRMTLRSPIDGMVTSRPVQEGSMAIPGATLFTLANLDEVSLSLYVPETQIGRVRQGQAVTVRVDAYPDRAFQGSVAYISPRAEFTPGTVQTQQEREKMVFSIKVQVPNADHALKPGMPADAVVEEVP
jgi:HlyD family secretion protein